MSELFESIKEKLEELKNVNITFEDIKSYISNIDAETILKAVAILLIFPFL